MGKSKNTKHRLIGNKKMSVPDEELCKGFPHQFVEYFRLCREMKYDDTPDYDRLCRLFSSLFEDKGFKHDKKFDWTTEPEPSTSAGSSSSKENKKPPGKNESQGKSRSPRRKTRSRSRSRRSTRK